LAVAEVEGICSAHAMVVRARPDIVLSEFLPFLMMSDRFMNRAVEISVGSLSPTINWTTLRDEEFDLPPLDQQQRIARVLCCLEVLTTAKLRLCELLNELREATVEESLRGTSRSGSSKTDWLLRPVHEICERVTVGIVVTPAKYYEPTGVPCFRSANVRRGRVNDADWVYISESANRLHSKSILHVGDVLVVRSGVFAGMSCVVPPELDGANCIDVVFATPRPELVASDWLCLFINSRMGQSEIKRGERGLAQKHFGVEAMNNLLVPLPPIAEQKALLAEFCKLAAASAAVGGECSRLRQLSTSLIESLVATQP
jgi:restriction endonuclease S subunit